VVRLHTYSGIDAGKLLGQSHRGAAGRQIDPYGKYRFHARLMRPGYDFRPIGVELRLIQVRVGIEKLHATNFRQLQLGCKEPRFMAARGCPKRRGLRHSP